MMTAWKRLLAALNQIEKLNHKFKLSCVKKQGLNMKHTPFGITM